MARIIVRIELTATAKDHIDSLCDNKGMTQVALLSRMVEWFAGEDQLIQAAVLGHYPMTDRQEVGRMILKKLAESRSAGR